MSTGPKTFLGRLGKAGEIPDNVVVLNPSLEDFHSASIFRQKNPSTVLIARLDGVNFYSASSVNLYNLGVQRGYFAKPILNPAFDLNLPNFSYVLNRYLNRVNTKLIALADHVVFQSQLSAQMHRKFLPIFPKNQNVILNGVDIHEFSPLGPRVDLGGAPRVLISASLYRPHKRLQDAVQLINRLGSVYPGIHLHVLGDMDPIVKAAISTLDLRRTTFHGLQSVSDLPAFYRSADLMLSLAIFDPCPNVVVEGLACGLPVITPLQSGAAELVGADLSKLCVDENIKLEYMKFQTVSALPKLDYSKYAATLIETYENIDRYRAASRDRVLQALDIRKTFLEYQKVWMSNC